MKNILKLCKTYASKIDTMDSKTSAATAEIRKLRIEANELRRERVIYDNVFQ